MGSAEAFLKTDLETLNADCSAAALLNCRYEHSA